MRRTKVILAAALMMVALLVASAAPAMAAKGNGGHADFRQDQRDFGFRNAFFPGFNSFGCGFGFDGCGFNTFFPFGFGFNNFGNEDNNCNQHQVFDLNTHQWVWVCD